MFPYYVINVDEERIWTKHLKIGEEGTVCNHIINNIIFNQF